jgi:chromosome segregation ATPase
MSTTSSADEWISRDDAAVCAGASPDTIKRDIKKHDLETRTGPRGQVMTRVADLVRIGRIRPDALTEATGAETAELHRSRAQADAARTEAAQLAGRLQERERHTDLLHEQVREKDRQLKERDAQIRALTATVERLVLALQAGSAA